MNFPVSRDPALRKKQHKVCSAGSVWKVAFKFFFLFLFSIAMFSPLFEDTKQPYSIILPSRLEGGNDRLWDGGAL